MKGRLKWQQGSPIISSLSQSDYLDEQQPVTLQALYDSAFDMLSLVKQGQYTYIAIPLCIGRPEYYHLVHLQGNTNLINMCNDCKTGRHNVSLSL